ncbi:MAG: molybdate ABC transporter substrate-binding protein [Pirellulales bacterium]|nr:molybdate ABC transporter substrate-binding protein [Pirellulales bacterium]
MKKNQQRVGAVDSRHRQGWASTFPMLALAGCALLALLGFALFKLSRPQTIDSTNPNTKHQRQSGELMLYCASGMRAPMQKIVEDYATEYGVKVQLQFGGSNTLLSQIELSRSGDLFLAGDESYMSLAQRKGLLAEMLPLATMQATIVVPRDNPANVQGFADLLRDDLRVAIGNPDQAAIGKMVRDTLEKNQWEALAQAVTKRGVFQPTVVEVANSVRVGAVDAGVVWNATVAGDSLLALVAPPEFAKATAQVAIGVLTCSSQPTAALQFARFAAARDRGLKHFQSNGFHVLEGDRGSVSPELNFYCAVHRRDLGFIIDPLEKPEEVRVDTVYNGCGSLTAQMKDAFVAAGLPWRLGDRAAGDAHAQGATNHSVHATWPP